MRIVRSVLLVGLLSGVAWCETNPPLAWQDCLRLAAQQNPDLRSAFFAQESSRSAYKGSFNGVLPHLSLSNSYSDASSAPKVWTAEGTASLDVINLSAWANIQSASAALKQSQAGLELASANALLSLYKAYTSVL